MAKQNETEETPSTAQSAKPNLSAEIAATIERQPGDLVRCTWIGGDSYRVNWWSARTTKEYDNPAIFGQTYGTHVVRQSRFILVKSTPQGLSIRDAATTELTPGRL